MIESMTLTHLLASFIGLYFASASLGILLDRDGMQKMLPEFLENPTFGYLGGILAFAIGAVIVSLHNDWSGLLAGFVSLIGWVALIEGVLMLAFRKWFMGLFAGWNLKGGLFTFFGVAVLLIGVWMLWAALIGPYLT